ncbi:MAG TPA: hypothetical protein VF476_10345 [Chitinophagaceae bacterium]
MTQPTEQLQRNKPDRLREADNDLVFSYLTMRNLIGISGILLPIVLYFFTHRGDEDKRIEPSISDYYYTSHGDVLVVLLSVLGVFLFTYKGYTWIEKALTTIAAVCAIGIGFSPTATSAANSLSIHKARETVPQLGPLPVHFIFAATFFIAVAIISLKFFPKKDKHSLLRINGKLTQKAKRNRTYKICGWTILACLTVMILYFLVEPAFVKDFPVVLVFESIAIWAFGISWLTKGETLWPDGEHYIKKAYRQAKATLEQTQQPVSN